MNKQIVYCCFSYISYEGRRFLEKIFHNKSDADKFVSEWDLLKLKRPRLNNDDDYELWLSEFENYKKQLRVLGYDIYSDEYHIVEHEVL